MKKIFFVLSLSLLIAACQKADDVVIDSSQPINAQLKFFDRDSLDIAPYLSSASPQKVISDSFQIGISNVQGFSYLQVSVVNDSGTVVGQLSFPSASNNTIAGTVAFTPPSFYVGDLIYTFTAFNLHGTAGNSATKLLKLYNSANLPPVIDSLIIPDSVQLDTTQITLIDLYAFVHDPNGLNDIARVYFNSVLPNGNPSSGNPFGMYDDGGASGASSDNDQVANDGTYSLEVKLPPNAPLGTFKFTFYAVDRSGAVSVPVTHNIKVY